MSGVVCKDCGEALIPSAVVIDDIHVTQALNMDPWLRLESVRAWLEGYHLDCKDGSAEGSR